MIVSFFDKKNVKGQFSSLHNVSIQQWSGEKI